MNKLLILCASFIVCTALLAPYGSTQTTKIKGGGGGWNGGTVTNPTTFNSSVQFNGGIGGSVLPEGMIPSLDAGKITTGVFSASRLGSGTPSSSNFLRGDGAWATTSFDGGTVANATTFSSAVTFGSTTRMNNVTWTWPGSAGTNGQFLKTNGSGTFSFATPLFDANFSGAGGLLYPQTDGGVTLGYSASRLDGVATISVYSDRFQLGSTNTTPNSVAWTKGSGSPEGVVTCPVGCLYSRTDGGTGTVFYVKESGSGNTGWVGK